MIKENPLIDVAGRSNGDLIFRFPVKRPVPSFLHGEQRFRTAVLTKSGRELFCELDKSAIIKKVAHDKVVKDIMFTGFGSSGYVYRAYDANSFWDKLNGRYAFKAAEKRLIADEPQPLGWEEIEIINHLRPIFRQSGFKLVEHYGATDNVIYMPFIDGPSLFELLFSITKIDASFGNAVFDKLQIQTSGLHILLTSAIDEYLRQFGYRCISCGNQLNGNTPAKYLQYSTGKKLEVLIDIHSVLKGKFSGASYRYKNWLLQKSDGDRIMNNVKHSDIDETVDDIKNSAIAIDPYLICEPDGFDK